MTHASLRRFSLAGLFLVCFASAATAVDVAVSPTGDDRHGGGARAGPAACADALAGGTAAAALKPDPTIPARSGRPIALERPQPPSPSSPGLPRRRSSNV